MAQLDFDDVLAATYVRIPSSPFVPKRNPRGTQHRASFVVQRRSAPTRGGRKSSSPTATVSMSPSWTNV